MNILITHKNLPIHFLSEIEISDNDEDLFTNGILFKENIKLAKKSPIDFKINYCFICTRAQSSKK